MSHVKHLLPTEVTAVATGSNCRHPALVTRSKESLGVLLLLLLSGCSDLEAAGLIGGSTQAAPLSHRPELSQTYGVDGTLTDADLVALDHLQWPQSFQSMRDRFGFPASYDAQADYFKAPTGQWVAISYAPDGSATGYEFIQPEQ